MTIDRNLIPSLLDGHRPRSFYNEEHIGIMIGPDVIERLADLLYSDTFTGTDVGFSAFIDRACEAAETEIALRNQEEHS